MNTNKSIQLNDCFEELVRESVQKKTSTPYPNCTLIEYSSKAVAVFGETKAIKDELRAMGGRFNSRLTFNGQKLAGWIFPKSKEQRLAYYFGLD